MKDLVKQSIIKEMKFGDKGFFSLVMFLRKVGKTFKNNFKKVENFRLLNAYSYTWKTQFPGIVSTLRKILKT